jgi:peptide/nickel transport system permease protein
MEQFFIKRLIRIPITVFFVTLIAFFLSKYIPNDPIENQLISQGINMSEAEDSQDLISYTSLYKSQHLDKPTFYISLQPAHFPVNVNDIVDSKKREKTYALLEQGYRAELLDAHYNQSIVSIEEDLAGQKRFSFPKLYWNGFSNQYHIWLSGILKGSMGRSTLDGRPVREIIFEAVQWTIFLVIISIVISFVLGISLGIFSSSTKHPWISKAVQFIAYLFYAMPIFFLASLLLIFFTTSDYGSWTNIFPSVGVITNESTSFLSNLASQFKMLILPIVIYTLHSISYISRQMESSLKNEMSQSYSKTILAKGLSHSQTVKKHNLGNALFPIITLFTSAFPSALSGSVIVETIFNIPGVGRLLFTSIQMADWNVVYGIIVIISLVTTIFYFLGDVIYAYVNPKVRFSNR